MFGQRELVGASLQGCGGRAQEPAARFLDPPAALRQQSARLRRDDERPVRGGSQVAEDLFFPALPRRREREVGAEGELRTPYGVRSCPPRSQLLSPDVGGRGER